MVGDTLGTSDTVGRVGEADTLGLADIIMVGLEDGAVDSTEGPGVGQLLHERTHASLTITPSTVIGQNFAIRSAVLDGDEVRYEHFLSKGCPYLT